MRLVFKNIGDNARSVMRRLGYGELTAWKSGQISYSRRLGEGEFPRLHAYVEKTGDELLINLHLDLRASTYGTQTAHGGEYSGPEVESEADRIKQFIASLPSAQKTSPKSLGFSPKKSFWKRLLGL